MSDVPFEPPFAPPAVWSPPRQRFRHRYGIHILLFVLTLGMTTLVGEGHYLSFLSDFGARRIQPTWEHLFPGGLWYSLAIIAILGAHEMGHYLMCRFHRVDATLPYFIPAPFELTGTMGAVIRIREAFSTRKVLFDIGVAGPIAGFVVLVPILLIGLAMSNVRPLPREFVGISLGEPLLFQAAAWLVWGSIPAGQSINMHPLVFAAWFGLLATAWNLLPYGQLDGGHLSYSLLRRRALAVSYLTLAAAALLTFVSLSWVVFTAVLLLMRVLGAHRHPPTVYDSEPLDPTRRIVALVAAIILIVCFTPAPIEPYALLKTP